MKTKINICGNGYIEIIEYYEAYGQDNIARITLLSPREISSILFNVGEYKSSSSLAIKTTQSGTFVIYNYSYDLYEQLMKHMLTSVTDRGRDLER